MLLSHYSRIKNAHVHVTIIHNIIMILNLKYFNENMENICFSFKRTCLVIIGLEIIIDYTRAYIHTHTHPMTY